MIARKRSVAAAVGKERWRRVRYDKVFCNHFRLATWIRGCKGDGDVVPAVNGGKTAAKIIGPGHRARARHGRRTRIALQPRVEGRLHVGATHCSPGSTTDLNGQGTGGNRDDSVTAAGRAEGEGRRDFEATLEIGGEG